ncbi:hypothetical protein F5Y16DRAFT_396554 [Xylariaceae sp. FL0255]|nr:hypothetical protein F5Y16DRAFT_396554 [Xylariaceae sp. FL0255]
MAKAGTLYDYLVRPNPAIQLQECLTESPYYTKSTRYPVPRYIRKWTEFNATTIQKLFNQRLKRALDNESSLHDFSHIHASYCRIHDEDSLEALLVKSNQSIILESLEHTSQDLLLQGVSMVRGGQAQLYHTWRDRAKTDPKVRPEGVAKMRSKWCPDWAGLVDVHGNNNILPGDTKLSRNWRSEDLKDFIGKRGQRALKDDSTPSVLWPIRQLLHYCIESHMRYGYIITDEELVIMRIRPIERYIQGATIDDLHGAVHDKPFVEFQSIPWQRDYLSRTLSVNLALYVLFILAANNGLLDWRYNSLVDEKLPNIKPQRGLCDEYPSFSTTGEHGQDENSRVEAHGQAALETSASSQLFVAADISPSRKRSRSLSSYNQEGKGSHKRPR